ncbi:hypothetical protein NQZ68_022968 [Dissostichus eleginoides]|nr:hypothetical protein NQZ68_022968 [Dissostichus eleginoides]
MKLDSRIGAPHSCLSPPLLGEHGTFSVSHNPITPSTASCWGDKSSLASCKRGSAEPLLSAVGGLTMGRMPTDESADSALNPLIKAQAFPLNPLLAQAFIIPNRFSIRHQGESRRASEEKIKWKDPKNNPMREISFSHGHKSCNILRLCNQPAGLDGNKIATGYNRHTYSIKNILRSWEKAVWLQGHSRD